MRPTLNLRAVYSSWAPVAVILVTLLAGCGGGGGSGNATRQNLSIAVTGSGSVSAQPGGHNCSATCSVQFNSNTAVTLTAAPAAGQVFSSWGGACASATGTSCTLNMDRARSVSATFVANTGASFALNVSVTGNGTVASQPAGIACGTQCSGNYAQGTSVTLTPTPSAGNVFSAWSGACTGTGACTVSMTQARAVSASFTPIPAQAGWSDEMVLTSGGGTRSAIDNDGNAILLFLSRDNLLRERIFTSRYTPTGGWSAPIPLENNATGVLEYQLAMDPASGKAMAVWQQFTAGGDYHIWARPFDPASGWGAETAIDNATARTSGPAKVGVDAQGNAIVIWVQLEPPGGSINLYANRYVAGSGWGTPQLIETTTSLPQNPDLYVAPNGNAVAVFTGGNSSADGGIWTNQYTSGSGWGTASGLVVRDVVGADALSIGKIAGDANGNATLVYSHLDIQVGQPITNTIYAKRYQGGWQSANTPISAPLDLGADLVHPFIQMSEQGAAIVLWANPSETQLTAAIGSTSGTWGAPTLITTPDPGDITGLAMDIDGQGHAFVAWTRGNNVGYLAQYTGTWGAPTLQDNNPETSHQFPSLAMNERGNAVLAWSQSTPTVVSQIVVRHYTSGR